MIQIREPNGKVIRTIPNDDFFNHISGEELLEDHPEFDKTKTPWSFVIFPPERVPDLYFKMKKDHLVASIKDAYEQQLGLIEICQGDYGAPTWVPITLDLNVGELKKEWYFAFCKKHGYVITNDEDV